MVLNFFNTNQSLLQSIQGKFCRLGIGMYTKNTTM